MRSHFLYQCHKNDRSTYSKTACSWEISKYRHMVNFSRCLDLKGVCVLNLTFPKLHNEMLFQNKKLKYIRDPMLSESWVHLIEQKKHATPTWSHYICFYNVKRGIDASIFTNWKCKKCWILYS